MIGVYDGGDTAGPMARTVEDLVALLDVIAGVDPADGATAAAMGKIPPSYKVSLNRDGMRGKRIGVLRQAFPRESSDQFVTALVDQAVEDMRLLGAVVVDPFEVPEFSRFAPQSHPLSEVRAAVERYLATTGAGFPKSLAEVVESDKFHPLHEVSLRATAIAPSPQKDPIVTELEKSEAHMRLSYVKAMQVAEVDAFVMP